MCNVYLLDVHFKNHVLREILAQLIIYRNLFCLIFARTINETLYKKTMKKQNIFLKYQFHIAPLKFQSM